MFSHMSNFAGDNAYQIDTSLMEINIIDHNGNNGRKVWFTMIMSAESGLIIRDSYKFITPKELF
jgi:hypothetical protein